MIAFVSGTVAALAPDAAVVDDTDAHDWVEVYFPSIGWVTFDPTPGAAPAATQQTDNNLGVTKSPPPATTIFSHSST